MMWRCGRGIHWDHNFIFQIYDQLIAGMNAQIWRLRPRVCHIAVTQVSSRIDRPVIEKADSQGSVLAAQIFGLGN